MNNHTKRYKDENGDYIFFDVEKFKSIFDSNARAKKIKKEDYGRKLADDLSCGYDTFLGWKKGKSAPQDLKMVHLLEAAMGLTFNSLLYSKEKQLENELKKAKKTNADLVLENTGLKQRLKQVEKNNDFNSTQDSENDKFFFCEQTNPFSLRYEGFSNLIDLLIGRCLDENADEDIPSTYAEELSYILDDYIYNYSLAELIGFGGKRNHKEIEAYLHKHKDEDDDILLRWIKEAVTDSDGYRLYDENGNITLKGIDIFKRLSDGLIFENSDSLRVRALVDEFIDKWDNYIFPFATISISIMYDDVVLGRYTYGNGFVSPTNDDRMDIVTDLLFLTNGEISKFALQNVKKFHVDQFESEIEIVYDLKDIM